MKISICGKGGCGKSSMTAMLAAGLKNMGYRILLVDADESNFGLHRLVGLPMPENIMTQLGGKKGFQQKMKAFREQPEGKENSPFGGKWDFDNIPEGFTAQVDGVQLMLVGKIHSFAEGCACPIGALSKMLLGNLVTKDKEVVVVDTEAGIEHFGRGLEGECDVILAVVDPTFESFKMAATMVDMGREANKPVWFVLNKATKEAEAAMSKCVDSKYVIGKIPEHKSIFTASLEGRPLNFQPPEMDKICRFLVDHV